MCDHREFEKKVWNKRLPLGERVDATVEWLQQIDKDLEACTDFNKRFCLLDLKMLLEEGLKILRASMRSKGGGALEGPLLH